MCIYQGLVAEEASKLLEGIIGLNVIECQLPPEVFAKYIK